MEPLAILRVVVPVLILICLAGIWRRHAAYHSGGSTRTISLFPLWSIPRRYLVDLHSTVGRCKFSGWMHAAVAGGFLASLAVLILTLLWPATEWLNAIGISAALVMLTGAGMTVWRRLAGSKLYPSRRSGGEWSRLGLTCAMAAVGLLLWFGSSGTSWAAAVLLTICLAELIANAGWLGPMRHAVAGALTLGFHPRPGRFRDATGRGTALSIVDLDATSLGVSESGQWDWTRKLAFDACVECGRCQAACPATAVGQPLNPKALIQDLIRASGLAPLRGTYSGDGHPNRQQPKIVPEPAELVPDFVNKDTLWSCTTCRACVEECPMMIEHVDAIIDMRRSLVMERGELPGKGSSVLANYSTADTPGGGDPVHRFDWAEGLDLPVLAAGGHADCLLWAGEAAFEARGQRTLRALTSLLRQAEVDFAILGAEERDVGDLARRLGDEATFQRLARRNIACLDQLSFNRIVSPDPHAVHSLTEEYPAMGGNYLVLHHSQLLAELLEAGYLKVDAPFERRTAFHDPCYLGRYLGAYDPPRQVLDAMATDLVELEWSRRRSRCCGWGGGSAFTDVPGDRRIPDLRIEDAASVEADVIAVACPNCATMLEGTANHDVEIADLAELLLEATGQSR